MQDIYERDPENFACDMNIYNFDFSEWNFSEGCKTSQDVRDDVTAAFNNTFEDWISHLPNWDIVTVGDRVLVEFSWSAFGEVKCYQELFWIVETVIEHACSGEDYKDDGLIIADAFERAAKEIREGYHRIQSKKVA